MADKAKDRVNDRCFVGKVGEEAAATALAAAGLVIVTRNWRGVHGELDIVAQEIAPDYSRDGTPLPWLVFVEVRTKRSLRYGSGLQSITPRKQAKLRTVAAEYVQVHAWQGPWRIDVVGILLDSMSHVRKLEHVRHAVTAE
jgi:putative endonuclease